jgi:hypothetical protein
MCALADLISGIRDDEQEQRSLLVNRSRREGKGRGGDRAAEREVGELSGSGPGQGTHTDDRHNERWGMGKVMEKEADRRNDKAHT